MSDTKDITVEYQYTANPEQTDSAFHCWSGDWETLAIVTAGERKFVVGSNGEMRIHAPDNEVWRYTDDLLSAGIDTDKKLSEFSEANPDAWVNNNWFEFYEVDGEDSWEVHDTVEEAIEAVKEILASETAGRE